MPRAYTGLDYILYSKVSKEAIVGLQELCEKSAVSRALYLDALIKKAIEHPRMVKVSKPVYATHPPAGRKIYPYNRKAKTSKKA